MIARVVTRLLQALAVIVAASILVAAVHDVSTTWDVWYYHLPFAARSTRLVGPDAYAFHATNQARYDGFPLLAERLQGLLWRLTGRPESGNLVAFGALAAFVAWLRRAHRVPLHLAALALLAVPLVQLHASSCYIDLPSNLAAAALVIQVLRLYAVPEPASERTLFRILALAAVVVNMRFQLHPLTALCLVAAAPRVLPPLWRAPSRRPLLLAALALPIVFAAPLYNLAVHHNPYYPMKLSLLGITFPGPEGVYSNAPPYLEHTPRPLRWLYSVLEIGIRPFSERRRWTIDQWAPEGLTANRMGGFFGAYAVIQVALLVWLAARDPSRRARRSALGFGVLTAFTAMWPQSHELRYYMYWMIVLVALNLILLAERDDAARIEPAVGVVCAAALGVVLWVTEAGYAYPSGSTFAELLRDKVDARILDRIKDGDCICVRKEPWTFLYAAPFHAPRRYAVKESEKREDCRRLPLGGVTSPRRAGGQSRTATAADTGAGGGHPSRRGRGISPRRRSAPRDQKAPWGAPYKALAPFTSFVVST
ncbi:MAG: hypothetical protein QM820_01895 [Minicystis sp.]